jgi:RNA polymerase sigma factor (sigma-70 family)
MPLVVAEPGKGIPIRRAMPAPPLTDDQRELVAKNLGLAGGVARVFGRKSRLDFEERRSAAFLGLCRAAQSFDADKSSFSNYGTIGARTAVRMAIRDSYAIGIGAHQHQSLMNNAMPEGQISAQVREQAERATHVRSLPFNGVYLPEKRGPSEHVIAEEAEFCASLLQHLDWRRRLVIRQCVMRGRKLREVGSMLGVTTERARQLRNEGLAKLREIAREATDIAYHPAEPGHGSARISSTS